MQPCSKGYQDAGRVLLAASSERGNESKEQSNGFFIRLGIRPSEIPKLRKIIIQLSMTVQAGIDYLYSLPLSELLELMKEVHEVVSDRQRIQAGHKNSRYY